MQSIQDLIKKEKELQNQLDKVQKAIVAFQGVCEHDWKSDNYTDGGGKRYKTCKICNESDWN